MIKKLAKNYKQFSFIYIQLLKFKNLEKISLFKFSSIYNINN